MSEHEKEKCKNCELCGINKLHADLKDSIIILKKIDMRTESQTQILEVVSDKINVIQEVASETALEITRNTRTIAENMRAAADTNKELIEIVAGKKQVPLSIFVIVLVVFAILQFISLTVLFGLHLKFGSPIIGGEIIKTLTTLI